MDSEFYVSLEAARLLKEKGYNEPTEYLHSDSIIYKGICLNYLKPELCGGMIVEDNSSYPCPTKAEAIDWLESKGIVVEVQYRRITGKYFSEIHYNKMRYKSRPSDLTEDYKTRLEAEEAAIINACKLLENGN